MSSPEPCELAGLRNLLVHLYWEVDDKMVYDSLGTELDDFETFVFYVMKFIEETVKEQDDSS